MNRPSEDFSHLPTWIPEGLIRASEAAFRDRQIERNMEERKKKILSSIRVTPLTPAEELLEYTGIKTDAEKFHAFRGKNVLDVGGGFSWFAPLAVRFGANRATVADPVFFDQDLPARLSEDLEKIRKFVRDPKDRLMSEPEMEPKLRGLIETNVSWYDRVYADACFWKGYSPEKFPSIRRLPAYAEDMSALPDGSQNFIFASNVLWKPTMDVEGFHREILRLLAPGWAVRIIDCEDDLAEKNHDLLGELLSKTRKTRSFNHLWFRVLEA